MSRRVGFAFVAFAAAIAAGAGCAGSESTPSAVETGRPRGTYVVVPSSVAPQDSEDAIFATAAPGQRTIFLNRWGGTYYGGWNDASQNRSSIISGTRTISAWGHGDAAWQTFYGCVQDQFARWNVVVTDQDPGNVPHFEAVVGGTPGQIGYGSGVGGLAPMNNDCSIVENGVVFVFSGVLGANHYTCEVAAQEIAHAVGLDHEYLCSDPMSYLHGCGPKTFQNMNASCGEYSTRACKCSAKQNSVQMLTARLGHASTPAPTPTPDPSPSPTPGEDPAAPVATALTPVSGAQLTGNQTLAVTASITDDVGVASAVLWWWKDGNWRAYDCDAPANGVSCSETDGTYTWSVPVGTGRRWWLVRAKDAAGHQSDSEMRSLDLF